ncbi:hypothetical protein PVAG01_04824 [Phlyctema vagabunda]|uniref:PARP catalytic domain-containing protein n=1 Tax=Phlyctema vagabunda TaxID=108571 RepID=A0ABR4PIA7_9HELO
MEAPDDWYEDSEASSKLGHFQISDDARVEYMGTTTREELRSKLRGAKIAFSPKDVKAKLKALWAMYNMGILDDKGETDGKMVQTVGDWCTSSAKELDSKLEDLRLDTSGTKSDRIGTLIRHYYGNNQDDMGDMVLLSRIALNLLLDSIYSEVCYNKDIALLPGCPLTDPEEVLEYINGLKAFDGTGDFEPELQDAFDDDTDLLSWICSTYGNMILPAVGELLLPDLPDYVHQFVVAGPDPQAKTRFNRAKAKAGGSRALFHGTAMPFLHSILCNGFFPSNDTTFGKGVFMAEDANHSVSHTFGRGLSFPQWKHTPFSCYRVVLGCEVAGSGRSVIDNSETGNVHVIRYMPSVIVRYIFLIDPEWTSSSGANFTGGQAFENIMLAAFGKINAIGSPAR